MSGRPIAHDKHPGIHPVGIGETWIRLFNNCVVGVTGPEATSACHYYHLCSWLKPGIDGAVHKVQYIWGTKLFMEDWGFLLADEKNDFSKINQIVLPWILFHSWPSGSRFAFNCYCHWSSLILRNDNGASSFLHSREGVMQEGPLAIVAYGIGILLLIKNLEA